MGLDYDLDLVIEGDGSVHERYSLTVRRGAVTRFARDQKEIETGTSAAYYTVPGLLDVIDQELKNASGPPIPGAPEKPLLRAEFDPERGYPTIYKRIAPYGQSRFIRVERFEPHSTQ